ncbi:hypothetical protein IQ266_14405 [filamentous cyanobacterium LEGE 11480]|uniref:Uncharacterized protein n=1 Tax=Romeriopsis navalis LEGE 11480 TaxID=2777977 RepID=A0A928VQW0_9CYAN|nr:hypothetical protein [Romeriopsis navalis]MBE9030925.1 hypothetical protein [Romeriopsis navalis LEGE 11480]
MTDTILTSTEITNHQTLLADNPAALTALNTLQTHNGDLETSFAALWQTAHPTQIFNPDQPDKSLLQTTLKVLRQEICGDEGFRGQVKEYTKNPGNATFLSSLIVSLTAIALANGIPMDTTIATIVVLWILKVGLNVVCEYTA